MDQKRALVKSWSDTSSLNIEATRVFMVRGPMVSTTYGCTTSCSPCGCRRVESASVARASASARSAAARLRRASSVYSTSSSTSAVGRSERSIISMGVRTKMGTVDCSSRCFASSSVDSFIGGVNAVSLSSGMM